MPRPRKCRKVCHMPKVCNFVPVGQDENQATVVLTVDEFEAIRLIDEQGFSQEECSSYMQVARTTAQAIYNTARAKIATALVEGMPLRIEGGDYRLCEGKEDVCHCGGCQRHRYGDQFQEKGEKQMRIAVTYEDGNIFQHFGHSEQFKLYDVEDGKIVNTQVVDTNGQGHGALAGFLTGAKVDVLICGGIGGGAQNALAQAGIQLYGGVAGSCDAAVEALLANNLGYNPNVQCSHHGHGEGHSCGGHSCGEDKHGCSGN